KDGRTVVAAALDGLQGSGTRHPIGATVLTVAADPGRAALGVADRDVNVSLGAGRHVDESLRRCPVRRGGGRSDRITVVPAGYRPDGTRPDRPASAIAGRTGPPGGRSGRGTSCDNPESSY